MPATTTLPNASSHYINLQTAINMTSLFRTQRESILATAYQGQDILPFSETFNKVAIERLLSVEGCAGMRIYYSMDETDKVHAVIVAVTEGNEDILPEANALVTENEDPVIVEAGQRCPPSCPPASDLNS